MFDDPFGKAGDGFPSYQESSPPGGAGEHRSDPWGGALDAVPAYSESTEMFSDLDPFGEGGDRGLMGGQREHQFLNCDELASDFYSHLRTYHSIMEQVRVLAGVPGFGPSLLEQVDQAVAGEYPWHRMKAIDNLFSQAQDEAASAGAVLSLWLQKC